MAHENFELALKFLNELGQGQKDFSRIDLTGAILEKLSATRGCTFKEAVFQESNLKCASFNKCVLTSAIFDQADLESAMITGSDCQKASFQLANLARINFTKSRLRNATMRKANLKGANFLLSDCRGVDFRGAILHQAEFRGAFFDETTIFDDGVNPADLGMRLVQDNPKPLKPERQTQLAEQKAVPEKTTKKKQLFYRGVPIESPVSQPNPAANTKATPDSDQTKPKKKVRMYRGVPVE